MRLGLFGGAFDPPHYGHLLLAEQCREQCRLDQVWLLPSGSPPHKRTDDMTPGPVRAEMAEFAFAGSPQFAVNRMELNRQGTTFTVDTLETLHAEDPGRELFFLIGADSLHDLPTWRRPERILQLATIVAVNRGDRPFPDTSRLIDLVGEERASRIERVTIPGIDLSSTDIRRRVREGRSIRFMVPRSVEEYIREKRLYRPPQAPSSEER